MVKQGWSGRSAVTPECSRLCGYSVMPAEQFFRDQDASQDQGGAEEFTRGNWFLQYEGAGNGRRDRSQGAEDAGLFRSQIFLCYRLQREAEAGANKDQGSKAEPFRP